MESTFANPLLQHLTTENILKDDRPLERICRTRRAPERTILPKILVTPSMCLLNTTDAVYE